MNVEAKGLTGYGQARVCDQMSDAKPPELMQRLYRLREELDSCHENAAHIESATRNLGGSTPCPSELVAGQKRPDREECVLTYIETLLESAIHLRTRTFDARVRLRELVG